MNEDTNKGRSRSPNYPYLSLPDAIAKACIVFEKDKLNATSPEVIVEHLGYNKLHGTSRRVLSAIKDYGLLEEAPSKRFKISSSGYKLCRDLIPDDERAKLLKEAARRPYFLNYVIEEFKGDLPSSATLVDYLVTNQDFSPDGAESFEKVLRETVEFANISASDFEEQKRASMEEQRKGSAPTDPFDFRFRGAGPPQEKPVESHSALFKYEVPLSIQRGVNALLMITGSSLRKRDLEVLSKKINDLLDAFEEEPESKTESGAGVASEGGGEKD